MYSGLHDWMRVSGSLKGSCKGLYRGSPQEFYKNFCEAPLRASCNVLSSRRPQVKAHSLSLRV